MVVDTLGHLLTLTVTSAGEQERAQVGPLMLEVQAVTSGQLELAYVARGYTGETPAMAAAEHGAGNRRRTARSLSPPRSILRGSARPSEAISAWSARRPTAGGGYSAGRAEV